VGIGAIGDAISSALGGGGGEKPTDGVIPSVRHTVKVGGKALADDVDSMVESVIVHDRLRMPSSFVITFRDPLLSALAKSKIDIGSKITIETTAPGVDEADVLIDGEVTSVEVEYDSLGTRAVVRGYDALHRLSAGTNSRTFENTTYSDIVTKIAKEAGLKTKVDSTSGTLDHVIQPNVSDLHFIYYLAGRCGYTVSVDKDTLNFKAPTRASTAPNEGDVTSDNPLQLVWGARLLEFRARISAVGQVQSVEVRGWDPKDQKAIIGQSRTGTNSAQTTTSIRALTKTSKGDTYTIVNQPMPAQGHADALAKAVAEQISSAAYEATALVVGSPKLKSGVAVHISKVDGDLEGKWVITAARHEFGNGPYRTFLEFSGRQDRSLLGLAAGAGAHDSYRPEYPGVVVGVVTDIKDPDKAGRVKVQYQWLGDKIVSFWARVARPSAGKDYGFLWFPDVKEEVVVAFEHGDVNFPIVIGSMWSKGRAAPSAIASTQKDGNFQIHGIASPAGHKLLLFDDPDKSAISFKTADEKLEIVLDQKGKTITIKNDGKELIINTTGDLKLSADGEVSIEAKKKLSIKAQTGVDIAASGGNTTIKGTKVAIN
jgi:uncharacterized protein involved in type VI secretion and phage assembly